jgi:REP element-mobilizing transposase RayT
MRPAGAMNRAPTRTFIVGVGFIRPEDKAGSKMKSDSHDLPKRRNIRLKHYDYSSDGYYFVTICAHGRKRLILGNEKTIENILLELPRRFPGVSIDYYVLMPSHIHVIFVLHEAKFPLSEVVRTFKALVTKRLGIKNFWQRGYYEHVIKNERALLKIREYIQNNLLAEKIEFEQFY